LLPAQGRARDVDPEFALRDEVGDAAERLGGGQRRRLLEDAVAGAAEDDETAGVFRDRANGPVGRLLKSPQWVVGSFGPGLPFRFSFLVSWRVQVTYRYSRRPFIGPAHGRIGAKNTMANITSQKKRIQRTERERIENRRFTSAIKTLFRRLEKAAEEGDASAIETEHRALVSKIDKAVSKGALHRNNGARKKSRAARIAASAGS
jgi:small subunit ribosomal protein S20